MQSEPTPETPHLQTLSREGFWRQHVSQWRESGLSKMTYAEQYSLIYHQMVYWCSKANKETDDSKNTANDFIAVSVTPTMSHSGLCIRLPNGIAICGAHG